MEVLGTYTPLVKEGVKEIRLRFSRVKFWLAAGAALSRPMWPILAEAGLIPKPPQNHGTRLAGWEEAVEARMDQRDAVHEAAREEMSKFPGFSRGSFTV